MWPTKMVEIAGWTNRRAEPGGDGGALEAMVHRVRCDEDAAICTATGSSFGVAACGHRRSVAVWKDQDMVAVVAGNPRFGFGDSEGTTDTANVAQRVAHAYLERGSSFLQELTGPFSLMVALNYGKDTVLAVDRMGICALYYGVFGDELVFSSDMSAMIRHPRVQREIDPQALFSYLYFHVVPGPQCIYRNIRRLDAGGFVESNATELKCGRYWEIGYQNEEGSVSLKEYRREFRNQLSEGVRSAIDGATDVGCFLSGGTDSSTIVGVMREVTREAPRTYSIGFDVEGFDELKYARIAARHFETEHHEYHVTPEDVVSAVPEIARAYGEPFGNSSVVPTYYCARMAKDDGITKMLGGDGGDELFGGNERYARQLLFAAYENIPAKVRSFVIESGLRHVPFGEQIPLVRKLRSYIKQANMPMPERLESYNLLRRFGVNRVLDSEFLETIEPLEPTRLLDEVYDRVRAKSMVNRMMALDLKITLADNDLPKVNQMCKLAGVEVAYPLLSDVIVGFSAKLPVQQKVRARKLRCFFKEALSDFLPQQIIDKKKHGFGLPFGPWLQTHRPLSELAYDNLSRLKKRRIVRSKFIDDLINVSVNEHASYYGTFVWVLMMLEQWFTQHACPSKEGG